MENRNFIPKIIIFIIGLFSFHLYAQNTPVCTPKIIPSGSTTFCQGQSVTLTSTPAVKYLWSPGNQTTHSIVVNTSGVYTVTTVDSNGCTGKNYIQVQVLPPLQVSIVASGSSNLCSNSSLVLSAYTGTSTNNFKYLWSNGETTQSIIVKSPGIYTVTVTNSFGCVGKSQPYTVIGGGNTTPPIITASGPLKFCQGNNITLTASNGYSHYLWSNGSTDKSIVVNTSGSYTVSVKDSSGCYATSSPVVVTVEPAPQIKIIQNGNFCNGGKVTLMAYPLSTVNSGLSYVWSTGETTQTIVITKPGTYYVNVKSTNGCSSTTTIVVNGGVAVTNPVITPSGPTVFCQGGSVVLTASSGFDTYLWSNGATTQSITVTNTGTYGVFASTKSGCSGKSNIITVQVISPPKITININNTNGNCNGAGFAVLTALAQNYPNLTYQWSNGATTQVITVTSPGVYTVVVSAPGGCKATATINVNFNVLPPPTVTVIGSTSFCQNDSVILQAAPGYSSYLWSNGATTQSIVVKNSGTFIVIVKNSSNCVSYSKPISIKVQPKPQVHIYVKGNTNLCTGGSVNLYAATSANNTNLTYLWSNGATTQNIVVNSPGTYTVTVSNGNACSAVSAPVTISGSSINPPVITASGPLTFCSGGSVTLTASSGYSSYLWSNGATTKSITVKNSGSYWVNVKNNSSCSSISKTIQVVVLPLPYVVINANNTNLCKGNVILSAIATSSNQNYVKYLWSNGATTQTIHVNHSGTYTVTVTNSHGCSATSSPIVINGSGANSNVPVIIASGPLSFCQGDSVILKSAHSYSHYQWSNGATTSSIVVKNSGTYVLNIKDSSGCYLSSSPVIVTVFPKPFVQIYSNNQNSCSGVDTLRAYIPGSNGANYTYLWSNNQTTSHIVVTTPGTYTVTVTSPSGCSGTSAPFVVHQGSQTPKPVIIVNGSLKICQGDSVILKSSNTYSHYQWSNGATTSSIVVKKSGTYILSIKDSLGCYLSSSPVVVTVEPKPYVQVYSKNQNSCYGIDTLFAYVSNTSGGNYSYLWSNNQTTSYMVVTAPGTYTVTVTSPSGCSGTSAPFVVHQGTQMPKPVIVVNGSSKVCSGDSVILTVNGVYHAYQWSNGATTSFLVVKKTGTYYVYVKDSLGCSAVSASVNITVEQSPVVQIYANGGTCSGNDSLYAYVSPGSGVYSYKWSTGETTQSIHIDSSGVYFVVVTSANGCTSNTASYQAQPGSTPPSNIITVGGPTTFCAGGSVKLTAAPGYQYYWSNQATTQSIHVTASGSYYVVIKNSIGCMVTSVPVQVQVIPKPNAVITATGSTNICQTGHVILTGSAGNTSGTFTYQWLYNNNPIPGATSQSYTATAKGSYSLIITNNSNCSDTSNAIGVSTCRIAKAENESFEVIISPNPSSFEFNVSLSSQSSRTLVNIYDLTGRLIEKYNFDSANKIVVGNQLVQGIYLAEVISGNNKKLIRIVKTE